MKTLIAILLLSVATVASADHRHGYNSGISPGAAAVIGGIIGYGMGRGAAPVYGGGYGGYPVAPPVVPVAPGGVYPDVRIWYRTEYMFNPACNCMVPVLVPSY